MYLKSFQWIAFIFIILFLSGCSNSNISASQSTPQSNPAPAPQSTPQSSTDIALPARRVFKGDWSKQNIGLTGFIEEGIPPQDMGGAPDAIWCTFPRPGMQGSCCIDPAPNPCYNTISPSTLVLTPGPITETSPGFPLITKRTFSKDYRLVVVCDICFLDEGSFSAFAGPVIYNGEKQGQYRSIYGQNDDTGGIDLIIDASDTGYISPIKISTGQNQWNTMQIHYYPDGSYRFLFNDKEIIPTGITDPGLLLNDPHAGFFVGGFNAVQIGNFEVWSDDPNETSV